jgi:hypothetical protein
VRFRHYKGGFYELVAIAKEEAHPQTMLVIYKAEIDGSIWSRPADVFFEALEGPLRGKIRFVAVPPEGFEYCCDNGCDVVVPYPNLFEYSREEDAEGLLIKSKTKPLWACHCCGEDVQLYETATGNVSDLPENE